MKPLSATVTLILAATALAGCGEGGEAANLEPVLESAASNAASSTTAGDADTTAETSEVPAEVEDPYEVYLANAPADGPDISREDAQLRAMLGCGTSWAPGTVDGVLQMAYADLVEEWRDQGLCETP